jgi:hypothetical protein
MHSVCETLGVTSKS